MRNIKLALLLLLVAVVMIVVFQNQGPWEVRFLWLAGDVPGGVLLVLTAGAGLIIGLSAALLVKRGAKLRQGQNNE